MSIGEHAKKTVTLKKSHIVIAAAVLAAVVGIGIYFIISAIYKPVDISGAQTPLGGMSLVLDDSMKAYSGKEPESRGGAKQGIKIPGYGTVRFPADTTDVRMVLLNPEGNPCYFTFELVIEEETYFTSNMVEPSMCIENLTLLKPLAKGQYTAILKISTYSLDENLTPMNGANVEFTLIAI